MCPECSLLAVRAEHEGEGVDEVPPQELVHVCGEEPRRRPHLGEVRAGALRGEDDSTRPLGGDLALKPLP